jgi:adenylate cyclase class 2
MAATLEREIKLTFRNPDAARAAVLAAGGTPVRGRRLQDDCLLDTPDELLRRRRSVLRVLEELGFHVWFRYQKYREEFALDDVIIAVDETPVGTYVEIEGGEGGIATTTEALGRQTSDYLLDSYRGLFIRHCQERGLPITNMLFDDD